MNLQLNDPTMPPPGDSCVTASLEENPVERLGLSEEDTGDILMLGSGVVIATSIVVMLGRRVIVVISEYPTVVLPYTINDVNVTCSS